MKKRIITAILCLALVICMGGGLWLSAFAVNASAEEITYSNVLDDLEKDDSFNAEDYPAEDNNYSINLITVAESENGELFVYVYQPSGEKTDLRASSTNIRKDEEKNFLNYNLTFLNSNGVFYKYRVSNFQFSVKANRSYEITSIYRPWNGAFGEEYDAEADADNTISEVAFPVGKLFKFSNSQDGSSFSCEDIEYIAIDNKYVGYVRYVNTTITWGRLTQNCDAHFVAFSTDRKIDDLLEADIYYTTQKFSQTFSGTSYSGGWEEKQEHYAYLQEGQEVSTFYGDTFVKKEASWDRIQTTDEFLSRDYEGDLIYAFPGFGDSTDVTFDDAGIEALHKTDWVLSFVETTYTEKTGYEYMNTTYYRVGDVSLLRLRFISDGQIFDLGVVDNKQSGSKSPTVTVESEEWWQKIMIVLLIIVVVVVAIALSIWFKPVFDILWLGIQTLFTWVINIVLFPFKLIGSMFKQK